MGPNRQKTQRWQDTLEQVLRGGGAIEISIDGSGEEAMLHDLVWRVRLLELNEAGMLVAQPAAARRTIDLSPGCPLVGAMTVGQNRWMFHTQVSGSEERAGRRALWLAMPEKVERCRRRAFHRISTAELHLPGVTLWPLRERASAVPIEIASRHAEASNDAAGSSTLMMPDVGPEFPGQLLNIGGGGMGVIVSAEHASALHQSTLFWVQIPLGEGDPHPLVLSARLSHVRMDNMRDAHAGFAFEFSLDPGHEAYVGERILEYAGRRQREAKAA